MKPMPKDVVLDIETSNTFDEVGGYFPQKLNVSVICAYFYETDTWESFFEDEVPALCKRLEGCDRIIGYNTIGFDLPVMNRYYAGDLLKLGQCDMLAEIHKSLGYRIKLDDVAAATIGTKKSAHGLLAVQWWKEGKKQEVVDYCMQDVKVTKEVFEFGLANGYILFDNRLKERQMVEINFGQKEEEKKTDSGFNLTMGF